MDAVSTPDDAELRQLDPFEALDREAARLEAHFRGLDAAGWARPSRCEGWTTRDMLSHLLSVEVYSQACLDDDLARIMKKAAESGATDVHSFNDIFVKEYAGRPASDVLDEWQALNADFRARMRERGREGSLTTMVGPYPVGWQAFHLASEAATHADDIGAQVDPGDAPARTEWRARFSRFALAEHGRAVEIVASDGRNVVWMGDVSAELSDAELVEVVAGRVPADHPLDPALREALSTAP